MATVNEQNLQSKDALASTGTAAVISAGDRFMGLLDGRRDEDWIRVELDGGKTYKFTLKGDGSDNPADDTILKLLDSKGGMIAQNDDVDAPNGDLSSELEVRIESSGTYYVSASSYAGNPSLDNSGNYVLTVTELGLVVDLTGTDKADKLYGTSKGEAIFGGKGNDLLDGAGGNDELDGGAGDDLLIGGPGADKLDGGPDTGKGDTISYVTSREPVSIDLLNKTARGGDADGDTLTNVENVEGSAYDDTLSGDRGKNSLWGLGGDDTLKGDRREDKLYGGPGADDLYGGDHDDLLEGGPGADQLTGGDGVDTASYEGSAAAVTVRLHASQAAGGDAEGDTWGDTVTREYTLPDEDGDLEDYKETVPDIVHLTGSAHNDTLAGDSRANTLMGMGGDDRLYGGPGGGNDELHGGAGNDRLFGGHGRDEMYGGAGDDHLIGGAGKDTFYGGYGSDTIYADDDETETIDGWVKDPENNDDTNDIDESKESDMDPDSADTLSYAKLDKGVGSSGSPITLDSGNIKNIENLVGTDEDDWLTGDGKDNVIDGLDGADTLVGGGGKDTVSYEHSDRRVTVELGDSQYAKGGHAQGDTISGFLNVIGSRYNDTLEGGTGDHDNMLIGGPGDDRLTGGEGDDVLQGGPGADELDGDAGRTDSNRSVDDTVSYAGSSAGVRVNLASASVSGGDAEGDEIEVVRDAYDHDNDTDTDARDVSTLEHVTGSDHNDRLTGDHRSNTLKGGKGDDTLRGGADAWNVEDAGDILIGGPGADELDGGSSKFWGADGKLGGTDDKEHVDTASYAGATAGITLDLDSGRGTAGDADGDTLISIEKVVGSGYDDVFIASEEKDDINGGTYVDDTDAVKEDDRNEKNGDTVSYELSFEPVTVTLDADGGGTQSTTDNDEESFAYGDVLANIENVTGSAYNDKLTGNDDANVLSGGAGRDELDGKGGDDTLLGGADRDELIGDAGKDRLDGGSGADELKGGADADTLIGGIGDDDLYGEDGGDTFVFSPKDGNSRDIIFDFKEADDRIDLSAFNLRASDLAPLITERGSGASVRVEIDLTDHGGGRITLRNVDGDGGIDALDAATGGDDTDGKIDTLSVWTDSDGDASTNLDTEGNGEVDSGEAGIFIL